jgi:uncharacterized protein YkwD
MLKREHFCSALLCKVSHELLIFGLVTVRCRMIFLPYGRYAAVAFGVALVVGCSATAIAPMTPIKPIPPIPSVQPMTQIPTDSQNAQSTTIRAQDSPSFIKVVDANHNQGLCVIANMHAEVLSQVNQFRAKGAVCGGVSYPPVKPLRWSTKLQQAADKHSHDMATHNFFNHKSASNGSTLIERLRSADYSYRTAGENIGAGPTTVTQVMDMWAASPAHCVILMTAHFAELGVSCKNNSSSHYKTYWTLKAAAPL